MPKKGKKTGKMVWLAVLLVGICLVAFVISKKNAKHEALTMMTTQATDHSAFIKALHERYPEINIELTSYKGYDTTEYCKVLMEANDIPDIYVTTYPPDEELQEERLIDFSGEDFITAFNTKIIADNSVHSSVYLLPTNMSLIGIYYNKTLFEKHGWEVPGSLQELEKLIPQIQKAGVTVAECDTQLTGVTFSYFFDVVSDYMTSLDGVQWMESFLHGDATATGNLEGAVKEFERWVDDGIMVTGKTPTNDSRTAERFKEGNVAFYVSNSSIAFSQNEDGTGDKYGIMPYLSEDGKNNTIITNVSMYIGLSKKLESDSQKLEDAMKVMEFIATPEGQESLTIRDNTVSTLKNETLAEDNPLYEVSKLVDDGKSMQLVYSGWEDYVVDMGQYVCDMMDKKMDGAQFLKQVDELKKGIVQKGERKTFAAVEENLSKEEAAKLVGAAFARATSADCSLISIGGYHGENMENPNGVNAKIYANVPLTSDVICTFNPLGWKATIQTMTLTGKEIKDIQKEGYYYADGDTKPFEYVLVTKDGEMLDDNTTYTIACVTESEERAKQGNMTDTGVVGQEALEQYIEQLGTLNSKTLVWK